MEIEYVDRISGLPDFVIHSILSLLGRKDAVRTSVLSKRWNRIWETFPDLIFDQYTYTNVSTLSLAELTPESTRRVGEFLDTVKRSLLRSTRCDVGGIKFKLETTAVDPGLCSKLDECFELALRSRAAKIEISDLARWSDALPELVFVSAPSRYSSLRELSLLGIRLSEKSIGDIFLSCPNIYMLRLTFIIGLAKLDVGKLDRLECLQINSYEHLSVDIVDAPSLRRFHYKGYGMDISCTLNLTSCRGLRKLDLEHVAITDELFRSLSTLCPLLENVKIGDCTTLRKATLSSKCLARLVLYRCDEIESIEIDAPALLSFTLRTLALPRLFLKTIPRLLEIVNLLSFRIPTNTSSFVNLRKFLSVSTLTDCLTVIVNSQQVAFDIRELRQVVVPPAFQLRHFKLELVSTYQDLDARALMDGLLWSCHPKTISLFSSYGKMRHSWMIKVLGESLLETENNPTCCGSSRVKCWRHGLKSATAQSFEETGADKPAICFELEWDNDSIC